MTTQTHETLNGDSGSEAPPTPPGGPAGPGQQEPSDDRVVVEERPMRPWQRALTGGGLAVVALLLVTQLIAIWGAVINATSTADPAPAIGTSTLLFGLAHVSFSADEVLIVMVLIVGGLGAIIGATRRFLYFAGRDQLTRRDEWSYLIRPLQGAILALIVYFVLRGGYLGQDEGTPINPYGVAALSALVGLFARHAVSKLSDIFDTMFGQPKEDSGVKVES